MAKCAPLTVLQLQELQIGLPLVSYNLWHDHTS